MAEPGLCVCYTVDRCLLLSQRASYGYKGTLSLPTLTELLVSTTVRTRRHGTFLLRGFGLMDTSTIAALLAEPISDRAFVAAFLQHFLLESELSPTQVEALPAGVVAHIGRIWLRNEDGVRLDETLTPLAAFRTSARAALPRWQQRKSQRMSEMWESLARAARPSFLPWTDQIVKMMNSAGTISGMYQRMVDQAAAVVPFYTQHLMPTMLTALQPTLNMRPVLQSILAQFNHLALPLASYFDVGPVLQNVLAAQHERITSGLNHMLGAVRFSLIGDLEHLLASLEPLHQAIRTFGETEYGFVACLLPVRAILRLASVDPRVRHAVTTNRLLPMTRSTTFQERLRVLFQQSWMLARRWHIVERGLELHRQGDYVGSIRVLMPEVDGIYGDMLLIRHRVREHGKTLYALDDAGDFKLDRRSKPIALHGLAHLVNHYAFADDDVMGRVAVHLRNSFAPRDRNPNAHGRVYDFGRPMLSLQIVLLLYVMAREFLPEEVLAVPDRGEALPGA